MMTRMEQVKKFARALNQDAASDKPGLSIDPVLDAMVVEFQHLTKADKTVIEDSVTGFELRRTGETVQSLSFRARNTGSGPGHHGPIPFPHECHTTIGWCWPDPRPDADDGDQICVWIEIPWPCPDLTAMYA